MPQIVLKDDETSYARTFKHIGNGVVEINHVTTSRDDEKVYMTYRLDLSNLDEHDIFENAAKNINIGVIRPRLFRTLSSGGIMDYDGQTIDPLNYPATRKSKMSDVEKARKAIKTFSRDEKINFAMEQYNMTREDAEKIVS